MFSKEINLKQSDIPEGWSVEAADLTNKVSFIYQLLKRKPKERLGHLNGIIDIKEHAWFSDINWMELYRKELKAPFIPKNGDNFDSAYCNKVEQIDHKTYDFYLNKINTEKHFADFYYNFKDLQNDKKTILFEYEGKNYKFYNIHEEKYEEEVFKDNNKKTLNNTSISTNVPGTGGKNAESNITNSIKESKIETSENIVHRKIKM